MVLFYLENKSVGCRCIVLAPATTRSVEVQVLSECRNSHQFRNLPYKKFTRVNHKCFFIRKETSRKLALVTALLCLF